VTGVSVRPGPDLFAGGARVLLLRRLTVGAQGLSVLLERLMVSFGSLAVSFHLCAIGRNRRCIAGFPVGFGLLAILLELSPVGSHFLAVGLSLGLVSGSGGTGRGCSRLRGGEPGLDDGDQADSDKLGFHDSSLLGKISA
jgi:hypothetical protein